MNFHRIKEFLRQLCFMAIVCVLATATSLAHDGVEHKNAAEALQHLAETENTAGFPDIKGGDFSLIDQFGKVRTSTNPSGKYQLLFFGYASCKAICSVALPRMVQAVDQLKSEGISVTPLLITVDPERDTLSNMKDALARYHPELVGLTGSEKALQRAYDAFQVEKSLVYVHPEEGPIYAHGSFIYLLDPDGNFKTLLPPILSPERIAKVAKSYISGGNS